MKEEIITLKGVRVNNLKNVSLELPHGKFIVFTGLSGSGKSSLAFDTLYAEGQRRYVQSLSVYARQFISKMPKPEADQITGIPPAIAIQQRVPNKTPRSTVGTLTEVYDYLRMLFAKVGHTYSPISGEEVRKHTTHDVLAFVFSLPEETPIMVATPLVIPEGRSIKEHLSLQYANGYTRVLWNNLPTRISDLLQNETELKASNFSTPLLIIDRLKVQHSSGAFSVRLSGAIETAFFESHSTCLILWGENQQKEFNDRFEVDGLSFEEPTEKLFSFNSSIGACPECQGYSRIKGISEELVVPNKNLSLYEGAVACWRGEKMSQWLKAFIAATTHRNFPIHRPYKQLSQAEKDLLWEGDKEEEIYGINHFFKMVRQNQQKMHMRIILARYSGYAICPSCKGKRLKPEAFYVKIAGKDIGELSELSLSELDNWLKELQLPEGDQIIGDQLLSELKHRVNILTGIGLGYLSLSRIAGTLSGGETQRITIAKALSNGLIGSLYVLDEPSIGLHPKDTALLIDIIRQLTDEGNTVVVVEHDEEVIRAADLIVELGPKAGHLGGEITFQGNPKKLPATPTQSYTVEYLTKRKEIPIPLEPRTSQHQITIHNAYKNNLKGVTVTFPLNTITVITGVSGSGKSSLVKGVLLEALSQRLENSPQPKPLFCEKITGDLSRVQNVIYVGQDALGTSSRSTPVTYISAYDSIRHLFALQPLAQQLQLSYNDFSFNREGGRCDTCKGEGVVTVEMQFMADMRITCDECHGKRFKPDVLDVRFFEKNIHDILELTVQEAHQFFSTHSEAPYCMEIAQKLEVLQKVGLGYIKLGQSSSTLSGGESQRLKLASYISETSPKQTLFIFDEPTTGLHIHDIHLLLKSFQELLKKGHSLIIIEHNLEVIKTADYLIDLGPEGGDKGGEILFQGTPKELLSHPTSYTAKYLRLYFND